MTLYIISIHLYHPSSYPNLSLTSPFHHFLSSIIKDIQTDRIYQQSLQKILIFCLFDKHKQIFGPMKHSQISTPQHPTVLSSAKQLQSLQQIFLHDKRLAWQVIDCQSSLYSETNTSMQKITYLTSLYMRIIQQLNTLQDPRQTYFSFKMQKLMHEPYIIRSFNNEIDHKKVALQNKKKQLQRKIEQEADRQNHYKVIEQAITAQEEKEKKINSKIKCIIDQSNLRLEERIKKRSEQRQNRFSPNRFSSNLSNKSNSPHKNHWADSHSNQFQLSIDQSDSIIKSIKRQLQEQQKLQSLHRKLNRTNTNPHSQKQL